MSEINMGNHEQVIFQRALEFKSRPENVTEIQQESVLPFEVQDALSDTMLTIMTQRAKKVDDARLIEVRRELALLSETSGMNPVVDESARYTESMRSHIEHNGGL